MDKIESKHSLREYLTPASITLILLAFSLLLHLIWCDSPMKASADHWDFRIKTHLTGYPFSIRYLTTQSTLIIHSLTGLAYRESFYILQYTLAFILGLSFYAYLKEWGFGRKWSNIGVFILMSSYPIVAAHFEPVHTWDDFWTYLFLILTFTALLRKKPIWGAVFFTLCCFSREQAVMYLPIYAGGLIILSEREKWNRKIIPLLLPVLIFGIFYMLVRKAESFPRYEYIIVNFTNFIRARDSIYSIFISFGFVWVAGMMGLIARRRYLDSKSSRLLFWSGLYMTIINTIFTISFTYARETRILFPPFVFLIPLALFAFRPIGDFLKGKTIGCWATILTVITAGFIAGGIYLAKIIFPIFEYRQCVWYCQIWAGVDIGIIATLITVYLMFPTIRRKAFAQGSG